MGAGRRGDKSVKETVNKKLGRAGQKKRKAPYGMRKRETRVIT